MSDPLIPIVTEAGFQAVFNADATGLEAVISHIALGDGGHDPIATETVLQAEQLRVPIAHGQRVDTKQIHLTAKADGPSEFWVREVGFILTDGTLLALWSHATAPLAFKSATVDLLLALDIAFEALPANAINISVGTENLNLSLASELVQLATAQIDTMRRQLEMHARLLALGG